ncbi:MAG: ROK family protein [Lachnospiraceae bacterium]|nr:ROK family protein [Lachnospiraceae bacterium]
MKQYLAFDIGGTFIKFAVMDEAAHVLMKGKFPTPSNEMEILRSMQNIYQSTQEYQIRGIAVSVPGLTDVKNGILLTAGTVHGLDGCHLGEKLSAVCDGKPVVIENDGKAAGLAEAWLGAAKGAESCCVLVFGTGVGSVSIRNGEVLRGSHLIAGEASHWIIGGTREQIKPQKFHYYGTVPTVHRIEKLLQMENNSLSGEEVFWLYRDGNEIVRNEIEDWWYAIALQCYNISLMLDPDVICIGGGVSEESLFVDGIRKYVHLIYQSSRQFVEPEVVPCRFHNDSNLIGALYQLLRVLEK